MTVLSDTEISNKKLAAGLLAIFFGSFGVHKFVLGYNNAGIIMLVVSLAGGVVTCGIATGVMSVIEVASVAAPSPSTRGAPCAGCGSLGSYASWPFYLEP